jgi:hypothetical protein
MISLKKVYVRLLIIFAFFGELVGLLGLLSAYTLSLMKA